MSVINNKFVYGYRVTGVNPLDPVDHDISDVLERHVIDPGADETYCQMPKGSLVDRKYTTEVLEEEYVVCQECHQINVTRHYARVGIQVNNGAMPVSGKIPGVRDG